MCDGAKPNLGESSELLPVVMSIVHCPCRRRRLPVQSVCACMFPEVIHVERHTQITNNALQVLDAVATEVVNTKSE